ncbi:MAG: S-layer homology domain-containing protein, partial [Peptoniphilus sp.]|nr:S-layer homology domain-containing protein [Peptoniphilus sp.]
DPNPDPNPNPKPDWKPDLKPNLKPDLSNGNKYNPMYTLWLVDDERDDLYRFYVEGWEDNFMPTKGITRAEIAQILARALRYDGYETHIIDVDYPDVDENEWYFNAVLTTTQAGVFKGMDDGNFEPQREITQGELIATLKRFQRLEDSDKNIMNTDVEHWASKEVNAAAEEGWLKLYMDGIKEFNADSVITREEVVTIANRAFNRPVDESYIDRYADVLAGLKTFKDVDRNMWSYYEILTAANTYIKERDSKTWINHAVFDEGPDTLISEIEFYNSLKNTPIQIKFQKDLRK